MASILASIRSRASLPPASKPSVFMNSTDMSGMMPLMRRRRSVSNPVMIERTTTSAMTPRATPAMGKMVIFRFLK